MNYAEIAQETFSHLYKSYNSLKKSPLESSIRVLIELRTSQINGCAYCCQLHTAEALEVGVTQEKLNELPVWQTSSIFSEKEKLALSWCDALISINKASIDKLKLVLLQHFSERELVDLTACVSIMCALNRVAVSLR